ncbi:hypothetical protein Andromeda_42 [Pseudomonas phage Andromeda]|uniref:Uncharacterized protein n=1 Tax=Pseudomonas phage Andromeda TaxID=1873949 RepID=A0A1B1SEJ1_9CAUD|nr:terminase small subunit [Pseudomonas phage Andromeda]ANU79117.1 hypothetical protein Andromeda_42 [Pseudomonas phage Andromeda]
MFTAYWEHRFAAAELSFEDEGYIPLTSNDLAVVRAFLKDNNITAEPGGDKDLARLGEQLARDLKGSVNQDELAGIMDEAKQWMGVPH